MHIASLLVISWREKNLAYADFAFLPHHGGNGIVLVLYRSVGTTTRGVNSRSRNLQRQVKGPTGSTGSFSLKAPANAFTIKNLVRHYLLFTGIYTSCIYGHLNMLSRCEIRILAAKFITARRFCQQRSLKLEVATRQALFRIPFDTTALATTSISWCLAAPAGEQWIFCLFNWIQLILLTSKGA